MCGITGAIWHAPEQELSTPALQQMMQALRHRGPDDEGMWRSQFWRHRGGDSHPGVALGFRRLAIIDLETGQQPISNEDGSVWMVFNGEIYNHLDLRRRLEGNRHQFKTKCDSEVIVHLYEDLGVDCFQHLNGMFAIAIWDERHQQLVLARDRLGQKPLYYRHEPAERLIFASELKSLMAAPDVPREISPAAIDQYLTYQYIPHPRTIYQGVDKVPPGHYAVCNAAGRLAVQPYWEPDFRRESPLEPGAAAEQLQELLRSSVEMRMQSDVPLGAFLSGGVDSSLIVALMQQASEAPIKTFTISFPIREYDESRYAQQVAQHLGTDHQQFSVTPDMLEILPKLVWHYDEPFGDSSAIPTWYISEHTRRHVTVALSGDGGDELFAGYDRYRAVALSESIDHIPAVRSLMGAEFWQWLPSGSRQKSLLRRARRFSDALRLSPAQRYLQWISIFGEAQRASLYTESFLGRLPSVDPAKFLTQAWNRSTGRSDVTAASLADLVTYLPCDLNTKVDIASMAHSLEVRQPFLDHRLVDWAVALPVDLKYRRRLGKRILRRAFGKTLPSQIWKRPKMGFGVPLDHWFRGQLRDLLRDTLLSEEATSRGLFRREAVEQMINEHLQRRTNHAARLWALLFLELWMREWLPTPAPQAVVRAV